MFCLVEYREIRLLLRGLFILLSVIVIGVSVSERQLHSLTQQENPDHAFSIIRNQSEVYTVYILGIGYTMRTIYPVGEIIHTDKNVMIKTPEHDITIPTYIEIDCTKELVFLEEEAKLLVTEAFKYKQKLELYIHDLGQKIYVYRKQLR